LFVMVKDLGCDGQVVEIPEAGCLIGAASDKPTAVSTEGEGADLFVMVKDPGFISQVVEIIEAGCVSQLPVTSH